MKQELWNIFIKELEENKFSSIKEVQEKYESGEISQSTKNYHKSYVQIHVLLQRKIPTMLIQYMSLFVEGFIDIEQKSHFDIIKNNSYIKLAIYNEIVTSLYMLVEGGQQKDKTLVELLPNTERYVAVKERLKKIRNGINHFKIDYYDGKITNVSFDELFECYLILLDEININYGNKSPLWINSFSDLGIKTDATQNELKIFFYYTSSQFRFKFQKGTGKGMGIDEMRKKVESQKPELLGDFNDITREYDLSVDVRLKKLNEFCNVNDIKL